MVLNDIGKIINKCRLEIPNHFNNIECDQYTIIPNHFHGIIFINNNDVGARHTMPLQNRKFGESIPNSLPAIMSIQIRRYKNYKYLPRHTGQTGLAT